MSEIKKDCTDPQIDLEISVFFFLLGFYLLLKAHVPLIISGNLWGMMGPIGVGKSHEAKQHSFSGPEVIQRVEF